MFYRLGIVFHLITFSILVSTCTLVWFINKNDCNLYLLVLPIFLTSRLLHNFSFVSQNYNAIGWAICPLIPYFISNHNYLFVTIVCLAVSYLSFTACVSFIMLSVGYSLDQNSITPFLCTLPAVLKIIIKILYATGIKGVGSSITFIARAIGLTKGPEQNYIRTQGSAKDKHLIISLYIILFAYLYFYAAYMCYPLLIFICMLITNFSIARYADEESLDILAFILLFGLSTSKFNITGELIIFTLILLNISFSRVNDFKLIKRPIDRTPFLESFHKFFRDIKKNTKVFFCFPDPRNKYEDLFSGQRYLLDFPCYCTTLRSIHLFPEFSTVFDTNKKGDINIWADSPEEVIESINRFGTDYCIVSQPAGTELSPVWPDNGFSNINSFDWTRFLKEEGISKKEWWFGTPRWFLLKHTTQ